MHDLIFTNAFFSCKWDFVENNLNDPPEWFCLISTIVHNDIEACYIIRLYVIKMMHVSRNNLNKSAIWMMYVELSLRKLGYQL